MRRVRDGVLRTNASLRSVPSVLWAQRKEFVLLKIDVPDVKNEKIEVEGTKVHFRGESQGRSYAVDIDLHADVVKEVSLPLSSVTLRLTTLGEQVERSPARHRAQA